MTTRREVLLTDDQIEMLAYSYSYAHEEHGIMRYHLVKQIAETVRAWYEVKRANWERAIDYANDCVDELAHKNSELLAENERLHKQVADLGVLHAIHAGTITTSLPKPTIEQVSVTTGNTMEDGKD